MPESINNKFINFEERAKDGISKEDTKASSDGIWMLINEKGYFDFDFKKNPFDNLELKKNDEDHFKHLHLMMKMKH